MSRLPKALIPAVALLTLCGCSETSGFQFESLSISDALSKAKKENRMVMIHFGRPG